ncbi:IS3 family transposase [Acinetobacter sp. VNH17]|uniref:IS3 family transposase n=2 Tax=Acinetobacter thutiue TaxID=2998078 RepID=A0ABT7WTX3_9GAMM|nr:IS3 family transposase [Acinetobacter thutiue]MCY6414033.1 IS3 family transposase [Acinetobacter thutiue]MDN0016142.1 IS3 family transposase [Acinetobacter thutiue]
MSRLKRTVEFKLEVVNHFFHTNDGQRRTAAIYGIDQGHVRLWANLYKRHGIQCLEKQRLNLSAEEKEAIILYKRKNHLSTRQAAEHFNIHAINTITAWEKLYDEGGLQALTPLKLGRPPVMKPIKPIASINKKDADLSKDDLLQQLAYLRAEVDYLKKLGSLSSAKAQISSKEKSRLIIELRHIHCLSSLLTAARMARSTFYYWYSHSNSDKYSNEKRLIQTLYHQHKGRYGYRRITSTLRRKGYLLNHKTVQKLMQQLKLTSLIRRKKYQSYKGAYGKAAPNILKRQFTATRPNQKWVTDVTEFYVNGKKLYLSPILDLYNGEIIAWQTSDRPHQHMVIKMFKSACEKLKPTDTVVLHSDQGWQYQLQSYQHLLQQNDVKQSMSRKGNCLDNAVMENFFGHLKSELFYLEKFESIDQLKRSVDEYIHYYNHERIKMKLGGLSPVEYRTQSLFAA